MILHWRFITVYGGEFGLIESITQWVYSRVTVPAPGRKNCVCVMWAVRWAVRWVVQMDRFAFSVGGEFTEHTVKEREV